MCLNLLDVWLVSQLLLYLAIVTLFVSIVALIISILNPTIIYISQKCDCITHTLTLYLISSYDFPAVLTSQNCDYFTIMALSHNCDFICINCDFICINCDFLRNATLKLTILTNLALMTFSQLQLLRVSTFSQLWLYLAIVT